MRVIVLLSTFLVPFGALAAPTHLDTAALVERQGNRPAKPKPCVSNATTTEEESKARFDKFADAFICKKNITAAFEFIRQDYIVCTPAQDGPTVPAGILIEIFRITTQWHRTDLTLLGIF